MATMRKIKHEYLVDSAKPVEVMEPVHVMTYECHFSEVEMISRRCIKALQPFNGAYQFILEFSDPEVDPRFNVGYVGAIIIIRAESAEIAEKIRPLLY